MWKPSQPEPSHPTPTPEPPRPAPQATSPEAPNRIGAPPGDQAIISKGLFVKGEISGTESLYIDGKVEGAINLPGNRVTVGRNGQVGANMTAREVVVLGKVRGNVSATDRVDIRAEGALSGDVAAARISIEDGAFFKGGIDIRKPDAKQGSSPFGFDADAGPGRARDVQAGPAVGTLKRRSASGASALPQRGLFARFTAVQPIPRRRIATLGNAEPAFSRTHFAITVQRTAPAMRMAASA